MELRSPTLLLDKQQCLRNLQTMANRASGRHLTFRPHFKTHQSATIGEWFRAENVAAITVSSVAMAEYFADHGWRDVTIAFPVNVLELERIGALAEHISLNCLVDSIEAVRALRRAPCQSLGVFIEIDTGDHRTGVLPQQTERLDRLVEALDDGGHQLQLKGFLTHAGHTYRADGVDGIRRVQQESINQMAQLRQRYGERLGRPVLSIGDTPGCSVGDDFSLIDEIRPGNFVFFDLMQAALGACAPTDIAVALACPVVAVQPHRREVVVHGGAVHLSKERLERGDRGSLYGLAVELTAQGWNIDRVIGDVIALSQEHGIIRLLDESSTPVNIGDRVAILPVHACLTANLAREYRTFDGDRIEKWSG